MNAYEKARDLIQRIERHRDEVNSHHKMIGQLEVELRSALKEADLKIGEGPGGPPAKAKTVASAVPVVARSHKKKVIAAPQSAPVKPAQKKTTKSGPTSNGQKSHDPAVKPTLGDLVRTVIIKADRPLKRLEIQAGLEELKYTNSTGNPYKTLGVRLHRLESRGVKSVGNGQFDVTPQWKKKHKRMIQAVEKKAAKEAAKGSAATETAAAQQL
jgi:hypothetical protein